LVFFGWVFYCQPCLHVLLDLRAELLVQADEEPEQVAEELGDGAVLALLARRVGQDGDAGRAGTAAAAAPARRGGRLALQADAAQGEEEAGHVGPLGHLVFQLVVGGVVGGAALSHPVEGFRLHAGRVVLISEENFTYGHNNKVPRYDFRPQL
jgi:hypothetical protein